MQDTTGRNDPNFYSFGTPELVKNVGAFNVAIFTSPLSTNVLQKIMAKSTEIDYFHVSDRELYWLCIKKQSESIFSNHVLEKTTGQTSTMRGIYTIREIVEKFFLD